MSKKVAKEIAKPLKTQVKQPPKDAHFKASNVPPKKAPAKTLTSQAKKAPAKAVTKIVTEVFSDIVEEEFSFCEQEKRTTPYMSQYEYCALISARIAQLTSRSAEWNIPKIKLESSGDYDPLKIATKEVQARLVSLVIRRKLPDGTTEDWSLKDMIFPRI